MPKRRKKKREPVEITEPVAAPVQEAAEAALLEPQVDVQPTLKRDVHWSLSLRMAKRVKLMRKRRTQARKAFSKREDGWDQQRLLRWKLDEAYINRYGPKGGKSWDGMEYFFKTHEWIIALLNSEMKALDATRAQMAAEVRLYGHEVDWLQVSE